MPKDGSKTKDRIIEITTELVLENGFAGTSIDQILQKTKLTKGAFFYHFSSKSELGLKLMEHFIQQDMASLDQALQSAHKFSDTRSILLGFVQHFIDLFGKLTEPYVGCLYASYLYEPEQFSDNIKDMVADSIMTWRVQIMKLIDATARDYRPGLEFSSASLADHFSVILEGAFITSKALNDAALTSKQLEHYKNYLELLFQPK
jgi:TetR/AcrR family transcriptional repressor of nem operon